MIAALAIGPALLAAQPLPALAETAGQGGARLAAVIAVQEAAPGGAPTPTDAPVPAQATTTPDPADATTLEGDGIVVSRHRQKTPGDPVEQLNAKSFAVVQSVDKGFVAPVAGVYKAVLPGPLRDGLHNVLLNLDEPAIITNDLLQHKFGRAARDFARLFINTTLGLGGLIDVAKRKPFKLPYRHNGFANTFAFYGVGPGAYLYLPLVGPTTVRDLVGLTLDRSFLSFVAGRPFNKPVFATAVPIVRALDYRVEQDATLKILRRDPVDAYAATRGYYLASRKAEIDELHGIHSPAPRPEDFVPRLPGDEPVKPAPAQATSVAPAPAPAH